MMWYNQGTYDTLLRMARMAANISYAPYTNHNVGAAALFLNPKGHHEFVMGSAIENRVQRLTICAEQAAIIKAVSSGYTKLIALAISDPSEHLEETPFSCGACLGMMKEFSIPETLVILDRTGTWPLSQLLFSR